MLLLANSLPGIDTVLSVSSLVITTYFWFIQVRREKPDLRIFQLRDFRAVARRIPGRDDVRRLSIQQVERCGVLIANNSSRQNSIVGFDCQFRHQGTVYHGDWGYVDDDAPPWNIGPDSSTGLSLACFFDVPPDFEVPPNLQFQVAFQTVSGRRFVHEFSLTTPQSTASHEPSARAA